ncbi:predicted protein [Streptomyces sp. SPB78]|nr:predicted protein [Streptomyces sp. SPB78]
MLCPGVRGAPARRSPVPPQTSYPYHQNNRSREHGRGRDQDPGADREDA